MVPTSVPGQVAAELPPEPSFSLLHTASPAPPWGGQVYKDIVYKIVTLVISMTYSTEYPCTYMYNARVGKIFWV